MSEPESAKRTFERKKDTTTTTTPELNIEEKTTDLYLIKLLCWMCVRAISCVNSYNAKRKSINADNSSVFLNSVSQTL